MILRAHDFPASCSLHGDASDLKGFAFFNHTNKIDLLLKKSHLYVHTQVFFCIYANKTTKFYGI